MKPDAFRDLEELHGDQHRHFCDGPDCENFYVCSRRDGCDHERFTCPGCEMDERDAHTNELELNEIAQRSA